MCENAILQRRVEGAEADEDGGGEGGGLFDAALDKVHSFFRFRFGWFFL